MSYRAQLFLGYIGQTVTVYTGINISGRVYVRAVDAHTGAAAPVEYWTIRWLGRNDHHGQHVGFFETSFSANDRELRASGFRAPTALYVTASEQVALTMSDCTVDELKSLLVE